MPTQPPTPPHTDTTIAAAGTTGLQDRQSLAAVHHAHLEERVDEAEADGAAPRPRAQHQLSAWQLLQMLAPKHLKHVPPLAITAAAIACRRRRRRRCCILRLCTPACCCRIAASRLPLSWRRHNACVGSSGCQSACMTAAGQQEMVQHSWKRGCRLTLLMQAKGQGHRREASSVQHCAQNHNPKSNKAEKTHGTIDFEPRLSVRTVATGRAFRAADRALGGGSSMRAMSCNLARLARQYVRNAIAAFEPTASSFRGVRSEVALCLVLEDAAMSLCSNIFQKRLEATQEW